MRHVRLLSRGEQATRTDMSNPGPRDRVASAPAPIHSAFGEIAVSLELRQICADNSTV
jgi:hypothetical protein